MSLQLQLATCNLLIKFDVMKTMAVLDPLYWLFLALKEGTSAGSFVFSFFFLLFFLYEILHLLLVFFLF